MTNNEMQDLLYRRMSAEQARYRDWLLAQPPEGILDHACEYTTREDILMEVESCEMSNSHLRALLKSQSPLDDIYREWSNTETNHMYDIRDVIEARAEHVIRAEKEKSREAR